MTEAKWSLGKAPTKDELFPPDLYPIENRLYSKNRGEEGEGKVGSCGFGWWIYCCSLPFW